MDSIQAQLAPVASSIEELTKRITAIADATSGGRDDIARELYEVERALSSAQRRLDRLVSTMW